MTGFYLFLLFVVIVCYVSVLVHLCRSRASSGTIYIIEENGNCDVLLELNNDIEKLASKKACRFNIEWIHK